MDPVNLNNFDAEIKWEDQRLKGIADALSEAGLAAIDSGSKVSPLFVLNHACTELKKCEGDFVHTPWDRLFNTYSALLAIKKSADCQAVDMAAIGGAMCYVGQSMSVYLQE